MIKYTFKKIGYATLTLFGVVSVIFMLFNMLPDDPAKMMLGQNQNKEQIAAVQKKYGLDKPIFTQYLLYINDLSPISYHSNKASDYTFLAPRKYSALHLFTAGGGSVVLAVSSIVIAMLLGVFLGIVSVLYKDRWLDKAIQLISTLGMSVPSFFSAILFAWVFGFVLHRYTGLQMTGSLYEVDDFGNGTYIQWKNLILPAIVLGIRPLAVVSQLMRNSLLEVLNQDYITTAKAKGLSQRAVIGRHALKNSLNPVVTAISGWFASMLAGAVFVEFIFGWNGIGKEIVDALNKSDLPVIMGTVIVIASLFIVINIFVDILYGWLDPKIRV